MSQPQGPAADPRRSAALRRLRACLALSDSPEPHEAAAALRQAEAIMREFGLSRTDAELSEVHEFSASVGRGAYPPLYLSHLATIVGEACGCPLYVRTAPGAERTAVHFVGLGAGAELAAYTYTVLGRQVIAARALYRKRRTRGAPHKRTARADAWAIGWVIGVGDHYAVAPAEVPAAVRAYMDARHSDLLPGRTRRALSDAETDRMFDGYQAGRRASADLRPGVPQPGPGPRALPGPGRDAA